MNVNTKNRLRRARRTRAKLRKLGAYRLSVHRTPRHIYAQILAPNGAEVIATASSVQKKVLGEGKNGGNVAAAQVVGKAIAEAALEKGVKEVAFDRSGFIYHGRVKALADAAREAGLQF